MPYPNFPDKHLSSPLVTSQPFLDYARTRGQLADFEPPAGVLVLYQRSANYRWTYNEIPQVALSLRSDFRRRHKEARLRLAELLARGAGVRAGAGRGAVLGPVRRGPRRRGRS